MQRITLDDIRREATALEIDMCIEDGFLDMSKRGDASLYYHSVQQLDDPRVIPDAWQWLQHYRTNVQQLDEARAQIANQSTGGQIALGQTRTQLTNQKVDSAFALARQAPNVVNNPACMTQCSLMLTLGGIIGLLTNSFFIGGGAGLVLLITLFGLRRISANRKSAWNLYKK